MEKTKFESRVNEEVANAEVKINKFIEKQNDKFYKELGDYGAEVMTDEFIESLGVAEEVEKINRYAHQRETITEVKEMISDRIYDFKKEIESKFEDLTSSLEYALKCDDNMYFDCDEDFKEEYGYDEDDDITYLDYMTETYGEFGKQIAQDQMCTWEDVRMAA